MIDNLKKPEETILKTEHDGVSEKDMIYRQAAIDVLERKKDKSAKGDIGGFYNKIIQNDIDVLMKLPSAERKKGEWMEKDVIHKDEAQDVIDEWQSAKCSECGRYDTRPYLYYFSEPRFCSWCGADMRGDQNETD